MVLTETYGLKNIVVTDGYCMLAFVLYRTIGCVPHIYCLLLFFFMACCKKDTIILINAAKFTVTSSYPCYKQTDS